MFIQFVIKKNGTVTKLRLPNQKLRRYVINFGSNIVLLLCR